ncbi:MAG: hypothetical protein J6S67_11210 [Methanobrevibacter sp.]|nr:hypothetical protein [Methanobrevibacter sp.]
MPAKLNNTKLKVLNKEFGKDYAAYVGILGSDASSLHEDSDYTNAQIGAVQEFGSISNNIPARSFIRMPLEMRLPNWVAEHSKDYMNACVNGKKREFYNKMALQAEIIIQEAFESRGFGQWKENMPSTIKRKGSDMPLIDTGALRRSISSEVVNDN